MGSKIKNLVGVGVPSEQAKELSKAAEFSSATVSSTPTAAELTAAFGGAPAAVGAGFVGVVDDNIVVSDGTSWRFVALTTAS